MEEPGREPSATTGVVESSVRARIILGSAGQARRSLHIFCTRRAASMPLDECRSCVRCLAYQDAGERGRATLTCRMAEPVSSRGEPPGQATPAGAVVCLDVTCVEPDVLLAEVDRRLPRERGVVPVVAPDGTSLGAVDLGRHRQSPISALRSMDELMSGTARVIDEAAPVEVALRTMAAARWRWIAVVTRERRVSGILWDVQAMHYLFGAPVRA